MKAVVRRCLAVPVFGVALVVALVPVAQAAISGAYVRPKGATPSQLSLVPAHHQCTAPNRTHGPSLAAPSCNPPVVASTALTVGTPDANGAEANSEGSFRLKTTVGTPGPPDDSDVTVQGSVSDVRCKGSTTPCGNANTVGGADYTGQLLGNMTVRITDRFNGNPGPGGTDGATMVDIPFPFPFTCASTASVDEGGLCTSSTTINAIVPGAARDGKRAVWDLAQLVVFDGGPDGTTNTSPNTPFMRQGIFVP